MLLSEFDYYLPKDLIAQEGTLERDRSRLMVLNQENALEHHSFRDLFSYLRSGDLLVLNDARVSKARLRGKKETGGKIDCLVLPQNAEGLHREVFLRPSTVKVGAKIIFSRIKQPEKLYTAKVVDHLGGAKFKLEFEDTHVLDHFGELPIPPYIKKTLTDIERYQTVYSKNGGSLAAPTAGLHFTPALLKKLQAQGIETTYLTLHIGIGTFTPIRTENVEEWKMQPEYYQVTQESAQKINAAIQSKRRIFAVGTTSVRALESVTKENEVTAGEGWTDLFIYPGYSFKFPYSGLLTNFHLPQSTLILLASAFAGKEKLFSAYQQAIQKKYRFYSLGDSMLILK